MFSYLLNCTDIIGKEQHWYNGCEAEQAQTRSKKVRMTEKKKSVPSIVNRGEATHSVFKS